MLCRGDRTLRSRILVTPSNEFEGNPRKPISAVRRRGASLDTSTRFRFECETFADHHYSGVIRSGDPFRKRDVIR